MKIPHKGDPCGDFEGALPRSSVLDTLYRHKINIYHKDDGSVEISTNDWIESHSFPDLVGGIEIRQIARSFGLPVTDFYILAKNKAH